MDMSTNIRPFRSPDSYISQFCFIEGYAPNIRKFLHPCIRSEYASLFVALTTLRFESVILSCFEIFFPSFFNFFFPLNDKLYVEITPLQKRLFCLYGLT